MADLPGILGVTIKVMGSDSPDKIAEATYAKRDAFWKSVGELEPDVIAPMVNPSFQGLPRWPGLRQAYRVIHLPNGNTLIATDGLSDPFDDGDKERSSQNGFEIELYIETDEKITTQSPHSWQLALLVQMGHQAAHHQGFKKLLDELKSVSMELYDVNVPKEFLNANAAAGVLMGVPSKTIPASLELPLSTASLISVTLLTPAELAFVVEKLEEGRAEIVKRIVNKFGEPLSSLSRASVV